MTRTRRPARALLPLAALAVLMTAVSGVAPASAAPRSGPPTSTRCGDDGCFEFAYQFVRVDKVLTGLGPGGLHEAATFSGQVDCGEWWGPDSFWVFLDAGATRVSTGVWVQQVQSTPGPCTITELAPDATTTSQYAVTGPTTLTPSRFELPAWGTVTDEDHPLLTVTSTTSLRAGSLSGVAWSDTDGDGTRDRGEPGLPGVEVRLSHDHDDPSPTTARTGPDGTYAFRGLASGDYAVAFSRVGRHRWGSPTSGARVTTVRAGESVTAVDQGYVPVRGTVFRPPRDR